MKLLGTLLLLPVLLFGALFLRPGEHLAVPNDYYEKVTSECPLEQRYTALGCYEVKECAFDAQDETIGSYKVWYPAELETGQDTYPLVIMANGTGVKASSYPAVFRHLASWGFVVVGNEDENSWSGASSEQSLVFMLAQNEDPDSLFYGTLDTGHIGVAGHSQGGVGAINAVTAQPNGWRYTALYTASATSSFWVSPDRLNWPYDLSALRIPYLMTAGTGTFDAGTADTPDAEEGQGITPLWSLRENYDAIPAATPRLMARRRSADHGEMLAQGDGVMTAWFLYQLRGDADAAQMFCGGEAELLQNASWQDVQKNF